MAKGSGVPGPFLCWYCAWYRVLSISLICRKAPYLSFSFHTKTHFSVGFKILISEIALLPTPAQKPRKLHGVQPICTAISLEKSMLSYHVYILIRPAHMTPVSSLRTKVWRFSILALSLKGHGNFPL